MWLSIWMKKMHFQLNCCEQIWTKRHAGIFRHDDRKINKHWSQSCHSVDRKHRSVIFFQSKTVDFVRKISLYWFFRNHDYRRRYRWCWRQNHEFDHRVSPHASRCKGCNTEIGRIISVVHKNFNLQLVFQVTRRFFINGEYLVENVERTDKKDNVEFFTKYYYQIEKFLPF